MAVPEMAFKECAPLFVNLPAPVNLVEDSVRTMEEYDQGYGCILYRTYLAAGPEGILEAQAVHDIGQVFLDGKRMGTMDRRTRKFGVRLPRRDAPSTLDILVEAMGRVNFGTEVHDRKGLHGPVKLRSTEGEPMEVRAWRVFNLPLDPPMPGKLRFGEPRLNAPAFWRSTFQLSVTADTFLDLSAWTKGFVWVNGQNLGRFWNIGPQQTMYLPGAWLKTGENEIIVLDLFGPAKPVLAGLVKPVLDQLRPEMDFAAARRPQVRLRLTSAKPAYEGAFQPGVAVKEVQFENALTGRYFALETLSAHDGKAYAAIAELDLLDPSGKVLSHEGWTIAYVDSEEREREDGTAENAIDGQTANFWHTQWGSASPEHPHRLVVDLGRSQTVKSLRYVPRQGAGAVGGRIKDFKVYVGNTLVEAMD
jgi:beta-galactosidase